jgi:polysaccharide export outer membrane protein
VDYYDPAVEEPVPAALTPPREKSMVSLPPYRVEPPDLLQIEVLKMVPRPPYRAGVYDVLQVQVIGTLLDQPIDGYYLIEAEGVVNLGAAYGKVRVAGMTIEQITDAITAHLGQILRNPEVSVQLARATGMQPISGVYLVAADGTVNLRQYGAVHVAGRTVAEIQEILQRHLGQFLDAPDVAVDVASYNSKVFYLVTEGAGLGDSVRRLPVTGNDTVLDAISQVGGLSQVSSKQIWVARPAPGGVGCEQILPVDWDAITAGASSESNYQLMPGDRVFIAEDKVSALTNFIAKLLGPAQQVAGFSSLTTSTIRGYQTLGRSYNRNRYR